MKCLFVLHDSGYRIEMFHFVHSSCGLSPWGCLILQTCPVFSTISIRLSVDFWSSGKTSHVRRLEQPMVITLLWRLRVTCFLSKVISQYQPPPPPHWNHLNCWLFRWLASICSGPVDIKTPVWLLQTWQGFFYSQHRGYVVQFSLFRQYTVCTHTHTQTQCTKTLFWWNCRLFRLALNVAQ